MTIGTGERVYEQMVTVSTPNFRVRGWLTFREGDGPELAVDQHGRFASAVSDLTLRNRIRPNPFALVREILDTYEFVSAVEFVDAAGNGACGYARWP